VPILFQGVKVNHLFFQYVGIFEIVGPYQEPVDLKHDPFFVQDHDAHQGVVPNLTIGW
jgi:hypothetical protein